MSKKYKLFICLTPLQMKIAKRIIEVENIQDYKLIGLFLSESKKYHHYFDLLKKDCVDFFVFYPKNGVSGFRALKDVYDFKKGLYKSEILKDVNQIYFASIDNRYVQLIASNLREAEVFTFDDGYANLNYNGSYYRSGTPNLMRKFLWGVLGVKLFTQNIRDLILKHYTIYSNKKNISVNLKRINLIIPVNDIDGDQICRILLGQPLNEVNLKADNNYLKKIINKLNIDFYFPHPRESYEVEDCCEIIDTDLIFEDYVGYLFKKYKLGKIELYTFFSTAVLNIDGFDNVDIYVLHDKFLFDEEIYSCFEGFKLNNLYLEILDEPK